MAERDRHQKHSHRNRDTSHGRGAGSGYMVLLRSGARFSFWHRRASGVVHPTRDGRLRSSLDSRCRERMPDGWRSGIRLRADGPNAAPERSG
jgi:hypothetical protein